MPGQHTFKCILRKYSLWHFQKYIQFWKVEKDFTFLNVTKKLPELHWVTVNDAKMEKTWGWKNDWYEHEKSFSITNFFIWYIVFLQIMAWE